MVVLVTTPTLAQEPPPQEPVVPLPEVRVSAPGRLPEAPLPLDHVPGSVQILTGEQIRESGAVTLQDALTRLPGVTVQDEQGNSVQPDVSFRGFQATSVTGVPQGISVFVDGVREFEPAVEAGSYGRQKYRLRFSGAEGPFDYYLSGTFFEEDGWRDASTARL